jgi:hypothetical protein
MNKVESLKELKEMLDQGLISPDEFNKLRMEVMAAVTPSKLVGNMTIPYSPQHDVTVFQNPVTGQFVVVKKWPTFWLTMLFGFFYLAYKEVWLHAVLGLVLGFLTGGVSWFAYPFFSYSLVVETYRRKGWVEVPYEEVLRGTRNAIEATAKA